jgi:phosphate starvation-inducible PhoH-like protein
MDEHKVEETAESTAGVEVGPEELEALVGPGDAHLRVIEHALGVRLSARGGTVTVSGPEQAVAVAARVIEALAASIRAGRRPSNADVKYALRILRQDPEADTGHLVSEPVVITHRGKPLYPKTQGQARYVQAMRGRDLVLCYGPAGTGKTYLAMAQAAADLRDGRVSRIVLTRPIMEAGERLGFLPGDVAEKVDPYLRPLYDALLDILGAERFQRQMARGTIEVVPLAYMRGRTINDAFMVLDEAQNTTPAQMKMFLTRMGFGSRMVVTGDITQTDLPEGQASGMRDALEVLSDLEGVAFVRMTGQDIVRHDLVQRIVDAYDRRGQDDRSRGGEADEDGGQRRP